MKTLVGLSVLAAALAAVPASGAKDFGPGDLEVCNTTRCVPIESREVLPLLGSFYYSGPSPRRALPPAVGTPYYELRFRNGYATGIVATRQLNRFLSYGVHLERFAENKWYVPPAALSRELRRLTASLRPLRLTRAAIAKSR